MPPLKKYCCCKLKTAVIVIGVLSLIGTFTNLFRFVSVAITDTSATVSSTTKEGTSEELLKIAAELPTYPGLLPAQIVFGIIKTICCALLFPAIFKKNHYLFIPWMIIILTEIVALLILPIILVALSKHISSTDIVSTCIGCLICAAIFASFWVAVYSYYVVIRDGLDEDNL